MKKLLSKIKGWKKISAVILGIAVSVIGPEIGLEPEVIENVVTSLKFYVIGQGTADLGEHMSAKKLNDLT